jgi:hypothetical protein
VRLWDKPTLLCPPIDNKHLKLFISPNQKKTKTLNYFSFFSKPVDKDPFPIQEKSHPIAAPTTQPLLLPKNKQDNLLQNHEVAINRKISESYIFSDTSTKIPTNKKSNVN